MSVSLACAESRQIQLTETCETFADWCRYLLDEIVRMKRTKVNNNSKSISQIVAHERSEQDGIDEPRSGCIKLRLVGDGRVNTALIVITGCQLSTHAIGRRYVVMVHERHQWDMVRPGKRLSIDCVRGPIDMIVRNWTVIVRVDGVL